MIAEEKVLMHGDDSYSCSDQRDASLPKPDILRCLADGGFDIANANTDVLTIAEHLYRRVPSQIERDYPSRMSDILRSVSDRFGVECDDIVVIGSARFGCSLRSGSAFMPGRSDLDLAIVSAKAADAWACSGHPQGGGSHDTRYNIYARRGIIRLDLSPDQDQRLRYLRWCSDLSNRHRTLFSAITVTLYESRGAFLRKQANEIRRYRKRVFGDDAPSKDAPVPIGLVDRPSRRAILVERAESMGFPCFLQVVEESFPFNTAPYLVRWTEFERLAIADRRVALLSELKGLLQDLSRFIHIDCMMIGGSFIRVQRESPGDLDVVIFYRARAIGQSPTASILRDAVKTALQQGVDARLVPLDGPPVITVKLIAFFAILYTTSRDGSDRPGMIVVEPPRSPD
jgi:hypothetical protein